jgi:hypothetical protein
MRTLALHTARYLTVLAIAIGATYAADLLPLTNPATAWAADAAAGCIAALAATTWLPCHCHRKGEIPRG